MISLILVAMIEISYGCQFVHITIDSETISMYPAGKYINK